MSLLHLVVIEEKSLLRAAWVALIKTIPGVWLAEVHISLEFFASRRERYPADVVLIGCHDCDDHSSLVVSSLAGGITSLPVVLITSVEPRHAIDPLPPVIKGIVSHHSTAEEMARVIQRAAEGRSSRLPILTTLHPTASVRA